MATKKESKNNNISDLKSGDIELTSEVDQKIELISSTDPNINPFSDDLQSEIDLFESELDESLEKENDPESIVLEEKEEIVKTVELEAEKINESEKEDIIVEPEPEKPKKTRKTKKSKTSESNESEAKEKEKEVKPKKSRSKKSKKTIEPEKKEPEIQDGKKTEVIPENSITDSLNSEQSKESVKKIVENEIVDINFLTDSISDPKIQASVSALYNENVELKANIEKSKKILRIFKKKLMLAEEKEEQWKACAYTLGDFFASKSNMALEDVLRRFEAPIEELDE